MSSPCKLLVFALFSTTLAAAAPRVAEASGPHGGTAAQQKAKKSEDAERRRLAKLRSVRADRCILASVQKVTPEEREKMSDLPWDAQQRRSVAAHYPLFSENDYTLFRYMTNLTLNRFGFEWRQLNSTGGFEVANVALRPAGKGEWMVVDDFKAECPQPVDALSDSRFR